MVNKAEITHRIVVFLLLQKRRIPVEILSDRVGRLEDIVRHLPQPVACVFGWSNDGNLQNVTGRYWWQSELAFRRLRWQTYPELCKTSKGFREFRSYLGKAAVFNF